MFPFTRQTRPLHHDTPATAQWTQRLVISLTILVWLALAVAGFWVAGYIITPLLMFIIASLFAYAIAPIVKLIQRVMPRPIAIALVYIVGFGLLGLLIYEVISTSIQQFTMLADNITLGLTPGPQGQQPVIIQFFERLGISRAQLDVITRQITTQVESAAGTFAGSIVPLLSLIAGALLNILLTAIISIYLLGDGGRVAAWLRSGTPTSQRGRIGFLLDVLQNVVGGYIRGQLILSFIIAVIVGIGMAILRIPYAVLLGVLSFVLEFIPVIGTVFTGVICVLIALTQGWISVVLVLGYFILVHIFEGYVLAPRIVGRAVGLHPVISLLALTAGAELFGPWGAIFAAPFAGMVQAFLFAFWKQWRKTHHEEFPVEPPPPPGEPESIKELHIEGEDAHDAPNAENTPTHST